MKLNFETLIDRKHEARLRREDKHLAKTERREREARQFIGELCREGRTIYYINFPYFESTSHTACVDRLVKRGNIQ